MCSSPIRLALRRAEALLGKLHDAPRCSLPFIGLSRMASLKIQLRHRFVHRSEFADEYCISCRLGVLPTWNQTFSSRPKFGTLFDFSRCENTSALQPISAVAQATSGAVTLRKNGSDTVDHQHNRTTPPALNDCKSDRPKPALLTISLIRVTPECIRGERP